MTSQSGGGGVPSGAAGGVLAGSYPSPSFASGSLPAMIQIAKVVVGTATPTISFAAIPQTYNTLILDLDGRGDAAAALVGVIIQFNGDTGANYDYEYIDANAGVITAAMSDGITSFNNSIFVTGSTAVASASGTGHILIPNYNGTVFHKNIQGTTGWKQDNTTTFRVRSSVGTWRNTVAITSIVLTCASGNLITGSTGILYGIGS